MLDITALDMFGYVLKGIWEVAKIPVFLGIPFGVLAIAAKIINKIRN